MSSESDVVIIGAGASGLSAAKELKRLGLTTTVVEGSHRIGGRAYSEEVAPDVWFDLGCSYLHQADRNPFVGIADELGVVIGKDFGGMFEEGNTRSYCNGVQLQGEDLEAYNRFMDDSHVAIKTAAEQGRDVAIADLVDLESPFIAPLMASITGSMTLDIDQASAADYASSWAGDDIPILNGYGNLVKQWGSDVEVSLNTRVEKIDWSGNGVSVETSKGTIKGRVVLSTVSNGILGAGDILFDPVLPDWKLDAIAGLPAGTENKICLHFDEDVFGPDGRGWHMVWNDEACSNAIQSAVDSGEDAAIADLIDLESEFAQTFMNRMAISCAQDIDQLSAHDVASFWSGPDIPILNGYGNLVSQWATDVDVSLNTRADRIDWSGAGVTVETPKGTLKAKSVLITVSNGILAANDIRFTPELPDWKTESFLNLPIGTMNKTCVHFDKDVFGPDGRGHHTTWNDDGTGSSIEASVMGLNTAVTFLGGRHAIWLEKQGQQAGHDFAVDQIANVFGNDIRKHVTRSIVTAWNTEPWTRGSYAMSKPGQTHQRLELARPIDDRLFFAGEATIVGPQACCHGAFMSGQRAAGEIAEALG